ncbi:hypothetical protein UFOVP1323_31 [uncultured Caudovirales phage]|uniref:DUF3987 domain-containing protein n=1 Tax=uncultured Caudovirales phage TaxID=2100421 RepID=A0A6J5RKM9_9CAUD|nr:hypothetical protein UFOVP1323_31 [uncultured Caudovirales phage]
MSAYDFIPKDSFIGKYIEYMSGQETPLIYDFMCACWALSIAVGRECYVNRPKAPVRLNLYVVLSSDSGVTRKSTSVRVATNLVRDFLADTDSRLILIESKITTGQLQYELYNATKAHGYAHVAISASELAAVLSRSGGLSGLPALLTDLYDCPDTRIGGGTVMMGGGYNLKNVYASFIAGSTPSWLMRAVTPAIIEGGFTSRCYFIDGSARKRNVAWPEEGDDNDKREGLRRQLREIAGRSAAVGRIEVGGSAISSFKQWYNARAHHQDAYRASFEAREDAHVLRFAALLAINNDDWLVNVHHLKAAINIVSRIKSDGQKLFSGTVVDRNDIRLVEKVRAELLAASVSGLSQSDILRAMRPKYRSEQVRSVLTVMHELDLVQRFTIESSGRPKTIWRATIYLGNDDLYKESINKLGIS